MIGYKNIHVTADRPNFPLGALFVRAGSAANIALVGVPVRPGVDVTALVLRVENVDGATADYAARAIGGVWVVDVPASHFATVGSVTGGVSVWATGTGADGETARTWCVGVGDLEVLSADADAPAPAPGQTFWPLRMFDAAPTAPTKYNAYIDGAALKIWNGVAWITISGGSGTVDDTVTRASANPVKSSGIWGAIWGALTALPTGFASLYDWCVAQLAEKRSLDDFAVNGWRMTKPDGTDEILTYDAGEGIWFSGNFDLSYSSGLWLLSSKTVNITTSAPESATSLTFTDGSDTYFLVRASRIALDADIAGKQDALSAQQLANIAAVPGKADAADLRYRIAEAEYSPGIGEFGAYILADRTVNRIKPQSGTASVDIELPGIVQSGLLLWSRDFFLDIDNSANASNLALEFTALGTDYVFVTDEGDDISEMTKVAGFGTGATGDGAMARFYFTETSIEGPNFTPVFHVARVTLGDFVTSTTTQGGNS